MLNTVQKWKKSGAAVVTGGQERELYFICPPHLFSVPTLVFALNANTAVKLYFSSSEQFSQIPLLVLILFG